MSAGLVYDVRPSSAISREFFKEIWFFRRLVWLFIWRDIVVRYKNTLLGAAWYIVQPVAMTIVSTLFFGRVFSRSIGDIPYPLFAYCNLLLWQLFSRSLSLSASSLVQYTPMLSKVYFPRLIVPASYVLGALFDFFLTSILLGLMMAWYGIPPSASIVFIPVVLAFTLMCAMGCGCVLAAIDARYRDVRHALPLLIQVWMFCSPVMYPTLHIPERWRLLYSLNPTVGLTEAFRWLIFRIGAPPQPEALILAGVTSLALFTVGVLYFQRVQGTLVDTL